ncbi:DJ-1/PfpI/YhbO family deglycase/protease [Acaryochloris sp. CCMEE 5410]|uniref:DJ-1/PfpI/YhbO family deglycase/protease n=1 Tax=Acaryochloris sp. CCMEE 5410 TaxID=310037 RepID=UPI0002483EBB|nr:DJ-1/PfpI/YhbO family deglycase/protease [Acaryochloris sp. CCMEE 5410]KAI9129778.1 DJ-1/PfpI/YhbO family deglycase/protease [Acaryochloris sp. CCMEE 5410]
MVQMQSAAPIHVAILLENQFEDSEFQVPYTALLQATAQVKVIGTRMNDEYQGQGGNVSHKPDATTTEVRAQDFDALVIPGGSAPDRIRTNPQAIRLVTDAINLGRLVAVVCHGPQVLIEADLIRDRRVTGFRAIRKDIVNAGGQYLDQPVVMDGNLMTARRPSDLPVFTTMLLQELGLTIPGKPLPLITDQTYPWWELGELWQGSSKQDILNALNTAIVGERYTLAAFQKYKEQATNADFRILVQEVIATKHRHVELLEYRLRDFGETVTWQAIGSEPLVALQSWLQSSDDESLMRRALGDLQTGAVDALHLSTQLTDPQTAELINQISDNLQHHVEGLGELYRARWGGKAVKPPLPTTMAMG